MPARRKLIPLVALVLAGGGLVAAAAIPGGPLHEYFAGAASQDRRLKTSGNIEIIDAEVSFKIAGRVDERLVDEGQMVEKGEVVARLDQTDLRWEVELRRAELAAAQAALAELQAGSRPEEKAAAAAAREQAYYFLRELEAGSREQQISAARAAVSAAEVEKARLEAELRRAAQLLETRAVAKEQFDRAKAAYEVALERLGEAKANLSLAEEGTREQQIDQARAALAKATAQYDLVMAGPRKEAIEQAAARVEQAKAAVQLAETKLGYATLFSPLSGVVISKSIEPGEYVSPGTPVVTVGDLVNVWLRAYINETDLGRVKLGQKVDVTTDTYPDKVYQGRVSFISPQAEFTPKNVQTEKERVKLVYRIKIDIANPGLELKPGMPADAVILLDSPAVAPGPSVAVNVK
ncbi:MAG: HlyD family secretion protein [Planctomycetota bacterium]